MSPADWSGPGRRATPPSSSSASNCAWRRRSGPACCAPRAMAGPTGGGSGSRCCLTGSAMRAWCRSSRSTVTCTFWCAGRAGSGAGPPAARTTRHARSTLPGSAYAGSPTVGALASVEASGRALEAVLLGPAASQLGCGPVIVVPPGRLHAVPWTLLPSLRDRAVSVAPSARAWLQARSTHAPNHKDPVFVTGPGLGVGGEVPALAAEYPHATVLGSGTATARAVLAALDGAGLAHIAAHGTFRADSPLFSSLRMDDGPLTVHDLERLRRAPYRVILPSCDSGVLAPAGADELLGLAHTLAPLGTAG